MTDIKALVVFRQLSVHQLVIEKKRVKASYTIHKTDGSTVSNELIYSYDQEYFHPGSAADVNLASMMVAQPALNYGLFFERIEFDGLFDETDLRFLTDMMENTSKEIYVNKFLSPNEFLKHPFNEMAAAQQKRYTAAELSFVNTTFSHLKLERTQAKTDKNRYAILSSGEIGRAHV